MFFLNSHTSAHSQDPSCKFSCGRWLLRHLHGHLRWKYFWSWSCKILKLEMAQYHVFATSNFYFRMCIHEFPTCSAGTSGGFAWSWAKFDQNLIYIYIPVIMCLTFWDMCIWICENNLQEHKVPTGPTSPVIHLFFRRLYFYSRPICRYLARANFGSTLSCSGHESGRKDFIWIIRCLAPVPQPLAWLVCMSEQGQHDLIAGGIWYKYIYREREKL